MGKIVYLMGKSSTGKDTIYKKILETDGDILKRIIPYTTRPIRAGEQEGVEYHFTDETGFQKLQQAGKVIEQRAYQTFHGLWRYFTVDDGQIDLDKEDYIYIGTLESYQSTLQYFGRDRLIPVLIELDDGVRLQRALDRERRQERPRYEEMCRRFLADQEDFSEQQLAAAQITLRFSNNGRPEECLKAVKNYILDVRQHTR